MWTAGGMMWTAGGMIWTAGGMMWTSGDVAGPTFQMKMAIIYSK